MTRSAAPESQDGQSALSTGEFIALAALLISLVALSIDAMLPALPAIGQTLSIANANDAQLVVSVFFIGMGLGQIVTGPLSDAIGRKKTIYGGIALFLCGCVVSTTSDNFTAMLAGRLLQGLGAAAPRIVTVAMVRDLYSGRPMARIMSFVMAVFIIVPAIAPILGQVLLLHFGWQSIFYMLMGVGIVACFWLATRQPETLKPAHRIPFSLQALRTGFFETCRHPLVIRYIFAAGLIQGAFLAYLSSTQQVFAIAYGRPDDFPFYFAILSLAIGAGNIVNGRVVMNFGMEALSLAAVLLLTTAAIITLGYSVAIAAPPPFFSFLGWCAVTFFCLGMIFGNINAMAMEPMGHMAGIAAATIGVLSTLISVSVGITIGRLFDGTAIPLIAGFATVGVIIAVILYRTRRLAASAKDGTD